MYRKMLIPLDRSELAEVVVQYAKELTARLALEVVLLHVYGQDEQDSATMHRYYLDKVADIVSSQSEEVQQILGIKPEETAVHVWGVLAMGHPAEEILRYADENEIDFILMVTHGRSGVRRWVLGSVADKVLSISKVPVWLVRADIPSEIIQKEWTERTILVPLDGSRLSESVLPHVEALAKQRGTELNKVVLLSVCEPPFITADYPEARMTLTWEEHVKHVTAYFRKVNEDYLDDVQKRLAEKGLNVSREVIMGSAAPEIIEYAKRKHPNLIVMTTHGHSGLSRWAYGSVADKVLHGASSPVFLVRPQ